MASKDDRCKEGRGEAAKKPKLSVEHQAIYGNEVPVPAARGAPRALLFSRQGKTACSAEAATCRFTAARAHADGRARGGDRCGGGLQTVLRPLERGRRAFAGSGPSWMCFFLDRPLTSSAPLTAMLQQRRARSRPCDLHSHVSY